MAKAGPEPGSAAAKRCGRPKGSLNKRTQELVDILAEMECSPERTLANITMGEIPCRPNPALLLFEDIQAVMKADNRTFPSPEEWVLLADAIKEHVKFAIPSLELIQKSAKDLMPYLRPTLKSVEVDVAGDLGVYASDGARERLGALLSIQNKAIGTGETEEDEEKS